MDVKIGLLEGILQFEKKGIVLFAHGSGSSRHSPRNQFVAKEINKSGIGTLLIDLLTREEDQNYETRFDIELLTNRVVDVVKWLRQYKEPIGLFGASTGAAAALKAAAILKDEIKAVVSRGGRTDMAGAALKQVQCPTLFIVGGNDDQVLIWNQESYEQLKCKKKLHIIEGATHLFEEEGALEEVAKEAASWFLMQLT